MATHCGGAASRDGFMNHFAGIGRGRTVKKLEPSFIALCMSNVNLSSAIG